MPTLTKINGPYLYSPTEGKIWINYVSGSSSVSDFKYIYDIKQMDLISSAVTSIGEFKIPPRPVTGYGLFSPSDILKSNLSYNIQPFITSVASASNSLLKYFYNYGCSYNPGFSFSVYDNQGLNSDTNVFLFTVPSGTIGVGDLLTLEMNNFNVTPLLSGTCSVIGVFNWFGNNVIEIDKIYATPSIIPHQGVITQLKQYTGTSSNYYAFNGTRQYTQPPMSYDFTNHYVFNASPTSSATILTNKPVNNIGVSQSETLSVIIDEFSAVYSGVTYSLTYTIIAYDKNNTQVGSPNTFLMSAAVPDIRYKRYDIPIGTSNLIQGGLYASFSNIDHYDIFIVTTGTQSTIKYGSQYSVREICTPYTNFRLAFINKLGGFDYFNFAQKSVDSINISRTEFRKILAYDYKIGDRQDTILAQKITESYQISTDWITEGESNWLKELVSSPGIYWIDNNNSNYYPVIINDTSYTVKTNLNDKLFCIDLNIRLGYDIISQNQ